MAQFRYIFQRLTRKWLPWYMIFLGLISLIAGLTLTTTGAATPFWVPGGLFLCALVLFAGGFWGMKHPEPIPQDEDSTGVPEEINSEAGFFEEGLSQSNTIAGNEPEPE